MEISQQILDSINSFFSNIGTFLENVTQFVNEFISDLVYVVKLLSRMVGQIPNYFSWLPSSVMVILVAIFSLVVIYQLLGRE